MSQPPEVAALARELVDFTARRWQQLQDDIDHLIVTWPRAAREARQARLAGLQQAAAALKAGADEIALTYATEGLHSAYTLGAAAAGVSQFTQVDVDALAQLAQDTYANLLTATTHVDETTKTLVRYLARNHVADRLLGGKTSAQAGRELAAELANRGVNAITYKDGSRHGLADYTEMLTRTQSALAYSTATINGAKSSGTGWLEVFDGFGCGWIGHADSDKANGTIRSAEECATAVISHPRCQRAFGPRPDVTTSDDAKSAALSQTQAQAADQKQVSIQRAARVQARARKLAARQKALAARSGG